MRKCGNHKGMNEKRQGIEYLGGLNYKLTAFTTHYQMGQAFEKMQLMKHCGDEMCDFGVNPEYWSSVAS